MLHHSEPADGAAVEYFLQLAEEKQFEACSTSFFSAIQLPGVVQEHFSCDASVVVVYVLVRCCMASKGRVVSIIQRAVRFEGQIHAQMCKNVTA